MTQVITTFCLTLLHSLWQGTLLFMIYRCFCGVSENIHASHKRKLLFILLLAQVLMSIMTFTMLLESNALPAALSLLPDAGFSLHETPLFTNILFVIYSTVVIFKMAQNRTRWIRFNTLARNRFSAPAHMRLFVNVKISEMGLRKKITVWLSDKINTPMTFGWLKPVILMPVALVNQLTTEEVETLLMHEIAHISSDDYLLNFFLLACEIFYFFNPFIRLLSNELKLEREKVCDLTVIQFKYPPLLYAGTLLKTARFQNSPPRFAMAAVSEKSILMERVKLITSETNSRSKSVTNPGIYAFLLLLVMVIGLFGVSSLKQKTPLLSSGLTESYAPNEVFSFVKETSMIGRKNLPPEATSSPTSPEKKMVCDSPEKKPCRNKKDRAVTSPEFVKAETPLRLHENYFIMPVATKEAIEKDVEITEENPETGVTTTTGLKMTWTENGWVAQPMWQTKLNRNSAADSTGRDSVSIPVPFYEAQ